MMMDALKFWLSPCLDSDTGDTVYEEAYPAGYENANNIDILFATTAGTGPVSHVGSIQYTDAAHTDYGITDNAGIFSYNPDIIVYARGRLPRRGEDDHLWTGKALKVLNRMKERVLMLRRGSVVIGDVELLGSDVDTDPQTLPKDDSGRTLAFITINLSYRDALGKVPTHGLVGILYGDTRVLYGNDRIVHNLGG